MTPWHDRSGAVVGGLTVAREVTDRKEIERQLRVSDDRWRAIFDSSRLGVSLRDAGGRVIDCNARYAEIFGATRDALIGSDFAAILAPAEAERATAGYVRGWADQPPARDLEGAFELRDGRTIWIAVTVSAVISDHAGLPAYQIVLVEDRTAHTRLQEQLAESRRMESLGRLAGGVSHELNNMLAVILGLNELVSRRLGDSHQAQSDLQEVRRAAEHCAALTRDLSAFGRQQRFERRPLRLSEIVSDLGPILRPGLSEAIDLVIEDDAGPAVVLADRAQIEQVCPRVAQGVVRRPGRRSRSLACVTARLSQGAKAAAGRRSPLTRHHIAD